MVDPRRVRQLNKSTIGSGPIVYWMSRDQRVQDNWALLYAKELADAQGSPLCVVFNLVPQFLGAELRQFDFMLQGLRELESKLEALNIPFVVLLGDPQQAIAKFVHSHRVGAVVVDFSPLRIGRQWREGLTSALTVPVYEVDAHNIVPCWVASQKLEFAARTFRPKIHRLLSEFLEPFPMLRKSRHAWTKSLPKIAWSKVVHSISADAAVAPLDWLDSGEQAAHKALTVFLKQGIRGYAEKRNDPNLDAQSNLSPYLHFGHLAAARIAIEVQELSKSADRDAFFDELVVRRELSDNFCFYNKHYDSVKGFPLWATKTLQTHSGDEREYIYTLHELEYAKTHDPLWNAAQLEMVKRGKMHGYMRMYWAKKILEWSKTPAQAIKNAIYLNDKYELDGRDPNGYAGIAWSIGGVHDRAWFERPIFGQIRYMNYNGAKAKFNVEAYIQKINNL